VRTV
jgi:hypothetical protein